MSDSGMVRVAHPMYGEARRARNGTVRSARLRGRVASALQESAGTTDPARLGLLLLESDLPGDPRCSCRERWRRSLDSTCH